MGREEKHRARALLAELERLLEARAALPPLRLPLVLVSQVQRSGGTLLSQLFDGHPQCLAHPHELKIGPSDKSRWPVLDLAAGAERWFDELQERTLVAAFPDAYSKLSRSGEEDGAERERFPFLLPPELQRALFLLIAQRHPPASGREVIDLYLTSFFHAWLDYGNHYRGKKRVVTAFRPVLATSEQGIGAFFADYPDGTLISVVRDPLDWFRSAARHAPTAFGDLDVAVAAWRRSVECALAARQRDPARVVLVSYERLVGDVEHEMRRVAAAIGIDWDISLLEPTFNGMPIRGNSAFRLSEYGIHRHGLGRGSALDAESARRIAAATADLVDAVEPLTR